jgi:hypothetical protein
MTISHYYNLSCNVLWNDERILKLGQQVRKMIFSSHENKSILSIYGLVNQFH